MTGSSQVQDGPPEANVRAAYAYLTDMVRKYADHSSLTLLNKVNVAELTVLRGPQVVEHSQNGRCLCCGKREPEPGYYDCDPCLDHGAVCRG